ncbi:class I SAM-dependent methyltransferase [Gemmatimonas sp.]|uniref:class I SAM-dependent methyltransferase n=1 Tax=Gemmatimonas sp. TaxID=1962908 RepID=UPI00286E6926|nr:class I SAM-dependent methyltransferase [Gemmatimonas sp.]
MATLIAPETAAASTRAFPAQTSRHWGRPRRARHNIGHHELTGQYRIDLRDQAPDLFDDVSTMDWSTLTWRDVGRPYRTEKWSSARTSYEQTHQQPLPIIDGWRLFNTAFHQFFLTDVPEAQAQAKSQFGAALSRMDLHEAKEALQDIAYLAVWNKIMRVEDAVWDPRGKRALFAGLEVKKPRILFLGAADGYEAMQLAAMYPGGEIVLVDYDAFCATDRFGKFPLDYPFLGVDPTTGHQRVWYRDEMPIHFEVADIRDLEYGREFDVVVSIGLLEHFPDAHKAECLEMHRRFLKPGGTVVMTTPRNQFKSRVFYNLMADWMNHGYRELMDVRQMGLYCHENGFEIQRAGVIKAHNGLVMKLR